MPDTLHPGEPVLDRPVATKYWYGDTDWYRECSAHVIDGFERDMLERLSMCVQALLLIHHHDVDARSVAATALEWSPSYDR